MSIEEMRSFCTSISTYQLRVHIRLKDGFNTLEGKIMSVEGERFMLRTDDNGLNELRFTWVAKIKTIS